MRKPTEVTIGQRIAQARRTRGVELRRDLLQSDVADALEVGPATVSRWEADQAVPRDSAMAKLAAFLGVTPAFLRYGITEPAAEPAEEPKLKGGVVVGRLTTVVTPARRTKLGKHEPE